MTGTGDVILTDIRKGAAKLVLARNLSGKFFINDHEDILVSEFRKAYGRRMSIGLERGTYSVVNQRRSGIYQAMIRLTGRRSQTLALKNFSKAETETTYARGDASREVGEPGDSVLITSLSGLKYSGYGGPVVSFGRAGDSFGTYVGGKGGLIINRQYVFGGGGFGLTYPDTREDITGIPYTGDKPMLHMGYGGVMFEYIFSPSTLLHATVGTLIGAGGIGVSNNSDNTDEENRSDSFFVLEPDINLSLNVTWFFKLSVGISYRYTNGINAYEFNDSKFSGFNARFTLSFGVF
jgi:hypothetical protein